MNDPRQHVPAFVRKARLEKPATHEITFRVRGHLAFPLDMLRREACHPATEADVQEIVRSLAHPGNDVTVTLRRFADERWEPDQLWHAHGYTLAPDHEHAAASPTPAPAPPPAKPAPPPAKRGDRLDPEST